MTIDTIFYDINHIKKCLISLFVSQYWQTFTENINQCFNTVLFMKKKILYTLLAVVIVVAILVALNKEKATQMVVDFGMALTSSVKHRDPSTEKAKFELTTEAFTKAFKDNAVDANKLYINQTVLLTGDVTNISGVTISLNNIACNIDSTEVNKLKELKIGTTIKVQGLVVGYNDLMEEIALAQCTIK